MKRIRELRSANGRGNEPFEFSMSPVNTATPDDLKHYRDAGIDELYLTPVFQHAFKDESEVIKLLEGLARAWVEPAARL